MLKPKGLATPGSDYVERYQCIANFTARFVVINFRHAIEEIEEEENEIYRQISEEDASARDQSQSHQKAGCETVISKTSWFKSKCSEP